MVAGLAVLYLNPFRLGLDLQGGVHVVLQAVPGGDAVTDEAMAGALAVVERRVNGLGVVEPVIQREGRDRIIVELPGLQDAHEAIRVIGQTAQLEIQDPFGQTVLTGADLADAHLGRDELGRPAVDVTFTEEGARKFAQLTTLWQGYQIPHLLDGELLVAPVVQEPITQGRGIITGNFTLEEARHLAIQLKSGALPVPLEPVEVRHVGPSLGADSLRSSWQAGIISGVLVILFMIAFYRVAGAVAGFCLCSTCSWTWPPWSFWGPPSPCRAWRGSSSPSEWRWTPTSSFLSGSRRSCGRASGPGRRCGQASPGPSGPSWTPT